MSKLISYYFKRDKWILLAMVALGLLGGFLLWSYTGNNDLDGGISVFVGVTAFSSAWAFFPCGFMCGITSACTAPTAVFSRPFP